MAKLKPNELLPRAEKMANHAVAELTAHPNDPVYAQNAAGKAWTAARLAAQAVVFCTTENKRVLQGTDAIRKALSKAAKSSRDKRLSDFRGDVESTYGDIHLRCSSDGDCSTRSARSIRDVQELLIPAAWDLCKHPP